MSAKMDQAVEKEIVSWVVQDLLKAGFALSVYYGDGNWGAEKSIDAVAIVKDLMATDDEKLVAHRAGSSNTAGWVRFVYGNDGYDVICDYTMNLEPHFKRALKLADMIEEDPGFMFQGRDKRMAAVRAAIDADLAMQDALA